jgi:hypothetical protein
MATANISLPQCMALRRLLYQDISENGFTQEFENQVLQSSVESGEKDITWETEADIDSYFQNLEKKIVK